MRVKTAIGFMAVSASLGASAQGTSEPASPASNLSRIERALGEARDSGDISEQQYQQSLSFLHDRPCDTVDRRFTRADQAKWSAILATHKPLAGAKAVQSFRSASWRIIYAMPPNSDPAFVFYSGTKPSIEWAGGATIFEAPEIEQWALDKAPGIPKRLARCFAWYVTFNREQ